ncbi:MAG: SGNH/GDSL hydrolase family protein [Myxococcota bacterium]|nr:SGNH/GDSL hydrolase family protein [Myxococcota bacterium]
MTSKTKKTIFAILISFVIWIVTEVFVGNVFVEDLRNWSSPPPKKQQEITLYGNPYLIFENVPGKWTTNNQHVNFTANINSMGFRAPELEIPKPDGIRRLITTGDSSVYGFGVEDQEVFSSVCAKKLGYKVEAVNAAVPGYSSYQSLNLLKLRGTKVEPDLFVIANIWSDNNFDAFVDKDILALYAGYEESFTGRAKRFLSKSAIFRMLDWRLRLKPHRSDIVQKRKVGWQVGSNEHIGLRRVSINEYANNLDLMVKMALSINAEVAFVMLANEEDIEQSSGDKAWTPYRKVMEDTANRYGAPLIRVPTLFQSSGLSKRDLFMDEMHPTAKGHAIMGNALAELLLSHDWANGGPLMGEHDGSTVPEYSDPFIKGATSSGSITGNIDLDSPIKVEGMIKYDGYESGFIQIDAMTAGRKKKVLNVVKREGPGHFMIPIGQPRKVTLRAYIDTKGDGPDSSDPLIDLSKTVLSLDQNPSQKVIIDLDNKTVRPQ